MTNSEVRPGPPARAGRLVRQRSGYSAFIPAPLPPQPPVALSGTLQTLLSKADRELGRLDGSIQILPNPDSQGSDLYDRALLPGYVRRLKGLERYKGTLNAWLSTIRHFPIQELESSYRAVGDSRKPVLLVWGKEDRVLPFATTEKAMAAIPQAELLAVEQAGHASHYEKSAVVNAAILSFLRRIAPIS